MEMRPLDRGAQANVWPQNDGKSCCSQKASLLINCEAFLAHGDYVICSCLLLLLLLLTHIFQNISGKENICTCVLMHRFPCPCTEQSIGGAGSAAHACTHVCTDVCGRRDRDSLAAA